MHFAIQLKNEHIVSVRLKPAKPIAFVPAEGIHDVSEAQINEAQLLAIAERLKTLPHKINKALPAEPGTINLVVETEQIGRATVMNRHDIESSTET